MSVRRTIDIEVLTEGLDVGQVDAINGPAVTVELDNGVTIGVIPGLHYMVMAEEQYEALVKKGYLHRLPEIIDTDDMFSWTIDKSKVRRKTYGIPMMICANALICRKEDESRNTCSAL